MAIHVSLGQIRQSTISDVIQIEPADFSKSSANAIEDNINRKYANKVIFKVGLCICFYDLIKASDGIVGHGTGIVNVNVEFRLIVFRPFKGEIIEGTLHGNYPDGIRVHLEFFDDITVPCPVNIFQNSYFRSPTSNERFWIWINNEEGEGADDVGAKATEDDTFGFYFEANDRVRFRVEEEVWTDLVPGDEDRLLREQEKENEEQQKLSTVASTDKLADASDISNVRSTTNGGLMPARNEESEDDGAALPNDSVMGKTKTAWRIVASMQQGGLGPVDWW